MTTEEQALAKARGIYPMANEDDYPDNPNVNRLNIACISAFMNGFRYAQKFKGEKIFHRCPECSNEECTCTN